MRGNLRTRGKHEIISIEGHNKDTVVEATISNPSLYTEHSAKERNQYMKSVRKAVLFLLN
jgi:hypothetical protein